MKRQYYLDEVERDLLRTALAHWKHRLTKAEDVSASAHWYAKHFTVRRIEALEARLQEPGSGKQQT